MKALSSTIVLGIGFLMVSGSPARAQFGDMGKAVQKGASDAAKQQIMKGVAEQVGLPTGTPAATPAADAGAANTPEVAPEAAGTPAADTGAAGEPAAEPEVAPEAAAPAGTPGAVGAVQDQLGKEMEKKMPQLP